MFSVESFEEKLECSTKNVNENHNFGTISCNYLKLNFGVKILNFPQQMVYIRTSRCEHFDDLSRNISFKQPKTKIWNFFGRRKIDFWAKFWRNNMILG